MDSKEKKKKSRKYPYSDMPDETGCYKNSVGSKRIRHDCEIMCRSNCSCTAYASFHDDGTGCELYFGDVKGLLGMIGKGNGTIYIRGHASFQSDLPRKRRLVLEVIFPNSFFIFLVLISVPCYRKWRKNKAAGTIEKQDAIKETASLLLYKFGTHIVAIDEGSDADGLEFASGKGPEVPLLSFSGIVTATDSFSAARKIGEGGFGPVYKGMLLGYEIAVKRLSRMSGQGLEEFKNEVQLISKLQHRNLVRLLGALKERKRY